MRRVAGTPCTGALAAALALACAPWAFAAQGAAPKGLAAKYHDDQGIAKDPAVIFADDFES
ncbi:MAG: hypothetical protein FJ288_20245, partial [Planctomycetes bacterium]|nr:hypothetical protein [Planctomycetota bacterium]